MKKTPFTKEEIKWWVDLAFLQGKVIAIKAEIGKEKLFKSMLKIMKRKKIYCENCRYVQKIEIKDATVYYCPLPTFLLKDADNTKYNCKYYKRKWWKFWI